MTGIGTSNEMLPQPLSDSGANETKPYRIIVAGSRTFNDYASFCRTMDSLLEAFDLDKVEFISGDAAKGPDRLIQDYVDEIDCARIRLMPADWDTHGKKAGIIRNEEMAKVGTHVVIFWDGKSRGTKHMLQMAKKYQLKHKLFLVDPDS